MITNLNLVNIADGRSVLHAMMGGVNWVIQLLANQNGLYNLRLYYFMLEYNLVSLSKPLLNQQFTTL